MNSRKALLLTFCAAPLLVAAPAMAQNYKAPRNALGQPDLGEFWSNATLTPESRPVEIGERRRATPEEIEAVEKENRREVDEGNAPIDPNHRAYAKGGELPAKGSGLDKPKYIAAGGAVGGYDRGWLETGDRVMRVNGEPRTSLITTPNGRPPPRKAGARAPVRSEANPYEASGGGGERGPAGPTDNPESRTLGDRCIIGFGRNGGPPMLPNGFYNNNYHFVQSKDAIAIVVEMVHDARIIRLNSTHRTDGVRPWFGDSIGRWEGDTLVVETTNFPQRQAYQGSWENLKVTERFTRVGKDRLHYGYQVEDATVWDAKWGGEYEFAPLNGRTAEYACHEGNYAMANILAGARAEEAAAPRAAAGTP